MRADTDRFHSTFYILCLIYLEHIRNLQWVFDEEINEHINNWGFACNQLSSTRTQPGAEKAALGPVSARNILKGQQSFKAPQQGSIHGAWGPRVYQKLSYHHSLQCTPFHLPFWKYRHQWNTVIFDDSLRRISHGRNHLGFCRLRTCRSLIPVPGALVPFPGLCGFHICMW